MVIVLSSNICNPGRGIVDISIDLCRIDITLNQGVLSIVEKVHSQQRLSRVKDDDKAYNNISSDARVSASNHVYGSSLWQLGTFEYLWGPSVRATVQTENNNNQQRLREFLFLRPLILPYTKFITS